MMQEEFFTLSEVKDGIITPTRVEELITLMQKEKDCEVKSAVEATRLHSAIAKVIVETKDTRCLDHFIKLGGLWYINGWLNDALKSAADTSGDFIEESVVLQCRALEKLVIGNEKLISSGLLDTIKNLCDHNSNIIKEKARELLNICKDVDLSMGPKDVEKVDAVGDNQGDRAMPKTDEDGTLLEVSSVGLEKIETSQNFVEPSKEEVPNVKGSDFSQLVEVEVIKTEAADCQMKDPVSLDQIHLDGGASSVVSNTGLSISEAVCCVVTPAEGIIIVDNSKSLDIEEDIGDEKPGAHENNDIEKVTEKIDSASAYLEVVNITCTSDPQESEGCSLIADVLMAEQTTPEIKTLTNMDCKEGTIPIKDGFVDEAKTNLSENSRGLDDLGLQKSLVRGSPERTSSRLKGLTAITATNVDVGLSNRSDEDYSKGSAIQNLARDTKSSTVADMRSDIGLDYGVMDALEVARQVAKAVEMEMVNDGSSDNVSDAIRHPVSPYSDNEIDSQSGNSSEESSSKLDLSPDPSTEREVESSSSEKMDSEPEKCMQGVNQPQALAQVQINTNKDMCEFDLNQEIPCENVEFSVNFYQNKGEENGIITIDNPTSMHGPVVSGSRSPLDASPFTGSDGWKGSAASSAFHQLSPHRDADPGYALSYGPSSISGKQGALSIDLNVDKEGHDTNAVLVSEKEIMPSSKIMPSVISVAAAPAKSKRLDFDLNMMSDADDAPSYSWKIEKQRFGYLNGHVSSSPASSSSSIQPRINIDLNEGSTMQSMSSRLHPFFGASSSQNVDVHQDAKPVISIMGARVEVNRNDYSSGAPSLSNGRNENHAFEANVGTMGSYLGVGPVGSYGHPSHFGYNNINTGPTMSFMSPMFRPGNTMTYMVDPRVGAVPQMVSSSSVVPHMYTQPPFFMSMAGPPPGLNGVLPSRLNFDLNLGFMTEGGNRQDMASRQLFNNNQGRFIGEHLNPPDSRPSSSFGKRKEPETGWETYPYNMRHHYPPGNK